jgi:hypothetical protein
MVNKKQIVFIEPLPNVSMYRLARSLRLTGKYETILFSFSKVDKEFFSKAYDKIFVLELSHHLKVKNLFDLSKKMLNGEVKTFLTQIENMNPYLFHITGPDSFSLMTLNFIKNNLCSKIYYSNDLWGSDARNFFFTKNFWIKGESLKFCENRCFRLVNGALHKMSLEEFEYLKYNVNLPKITLPLGCLDEWTFLPKQKKDKEIHIAYGGSPNVIGDESISFMEIIKTITLQGIHFHTYGPCLNEKTDQIFNKESKKNKYYFNHKKVTPYKLNEEISHYTYGILLSFFEQSKADSNPAIVKTQLSSRMVNYIEAGLPIIVNRQCQYMTEIIEKNNIGFSIGVGDLKNLKKIIEQKDYPQFQKNVKKFQKEFRWSKKIKDIEEFYEKVIKNV